MNCAWPARLLCLAAVLWLMLVGTQALAHASLVRTEPANASVLAQPPSAVTLTFNEDVTPTRIELVEPDGSSIEPRAIHTDGATLSVQLPTLGQGSHALSWHAISADGHPISGVLAFSVGTAAAQPTPVSGQMPGSLAAAIWLARVALYLGLLFGVGGVFFGAWVAAGAAQPHGGTGRSTRRTVDAALVLGLLSALASPGLQGADMLGLGLAQGMGLRAWQTGAASPYGPTLGIAACALVLALAAHRLRAPGAARGASLLALAGVGLALSASGHASTAPPQWLTRPAVFLHAVSAALWVGALLPLAAALHRGDALGPRVLARFSRLIVYPLVALVLAGIALAAIQLEHPSALFTTDYGRVLVLKLALVALVLLLAAHNRWHLTEAAVQARPDAARRLRRSIAVETVVLLAILAVVALWRFTVPPRSSGHAAHAAPAPLSLQLHGPNARVDLQLAPGRSGSVTITATLGDGASHAMAAREVDFTLSNEAAGIEGLHAVATQVAPGLWRADGVPIPTAGRWTVRIAILVDEFTQMRLEGTLTLSR